FCAFRVFRHVRARIYDPVTGDPNIARDPFFQDSVQVCSIRDEEIRRPSAVDDCSVVTELSDFPWCLSHRRCPLTYLSVTSSYHSVKVKKRHAAETVCSEGEFNMKPTDQTIN